MILSDARALPADHPLKPLELRMLEMCNDLGPLRHMGGNFVAALRVFAGKHPTLHEASDCFEVFDTTDEATGESVRGIRMRYPHSEG